MKNHEYSATQCKSTKHNTNTKLQCTFIKHVKLFTISNLEISPPNMETHT